MGKRTTIIIDLENTTPIDENQEWDDLMMAGIFGKVLELYVKNRKLYRDTDTIENIEFTVDDIQSKCWVSKKNIQTVLDSLYNASVLSKIQYKDKEQTENIYTITDSLINPEYDKYSEYSKT